MTKKQIKIAKFILKNHNLSEIQNKFGLDYLELQESLGTNQIYFSDYNMDDSTKLTLSNKLTEELEIENRRLTDVWFTRILAIIAIAVSVGALTVSIISLNKQTDDRKNNSNSGHGNEQIIKRSIVINLENFF